MRIDSDAAALTVHTALPRRHTPSSAQHGILTRNEAMLTLLDQARLVARSEASILVQGESGTGKELLARFIHQQSERARAPFIALNCSAIPEGLLESELFGHVRGAFSGATGSHPGLFAAAEGGTLFLDEIGDMPVSLQAKLLRVLQERTVRAVGTSHHRPIDVRVISATHRNLEQERACGRFREDLYYRIKVVSLELPPLRERTEDIPLLAEHFVKQIAQRDGKPLSGLSAAALTALCQADWPGNVRQLQNVIEHACALSRGGVISCVGLGARKDETSCPLPNFTEARIRFEHDYLVRLLKLTAGRVADAARIAARNRTEFYRLLQRHQLDPARFRTGSDPRA
ncbi:sigma-54 interaction domain-containing protein [Parazoarcus communis]|uniref:sigma-54 interaction domain-containing protein n=1 Tax=Parazoarcus communis TaxID=41977 RepID=UPI0031F3A803